MNSAPGPKNAATVILLREEEKDGIEVFLTRRPEAMGFLGGVYVFPGGTVGKEDYSEKILKRCAGLSRQNAKRILGARLKPDFALGNWVAGIRELFEETGVLLCASEDRHPVETDDRKLDQRRREIIQKKLTFRALLESENLFCDAGRLLYFSHWLTPEEFAARFDTRFFLALLPPGQVPLERSEEVAQGLWIAPERAMQRYAQGKLPMIFPTYASLRTLADFDTVESLVKEYGRG